MKQIRYNLAIKKAVNEVIWAEPQTAASTAPHVLVAQGNQKETANQEL